jgi:DNA-binding MarR family transcriptional regulator
MSSVKREAADRMHSAAIHLLRFARRADEAMGITPSRASALSVLVFAGPQTLTALADAEQVTTATMSRLVDALEKEKLVRRYPDVNDARAIRIEATPRGRQILERGRERRLDRLEELLEGVSEREARIVREAAEIVDRLSLQNLP